MFTCKPDCAYLAKLFQLLFIFICLSEFGLTGCSESLPQSKKNLSELDRPVNNRLLSGTPLPANNNFDKIKYTSADLTRGGQLYDSWFNVLNSQAPTTINPIWSLAGSIKTAAADTWRCSSCHGWDYLGVNGNYGDTSNPLYSGIQGIIPAINQFNEQEIWTFIREGIVSDGNAIAKHDFINQLSDDDIYALSKFIVTVRQEVENQASPLSIINSKATVNGDEINGAKLFSRNAPDSCANCHGIDGNAVNGVSVRLAASTNPAQALHRIRFGIANSGRPMPGVIKNLGQDPQLAGDITAFAAHGVDANHIHGGRLYDDWTIESGIDTANVTPNPLWEIAPFPDSIPTGVNTDPLQSWRCANCHSYNYEGGNGFEFNNLLNLKESSGWTTANGADSFTYLYKFLKEGFLALINGKVIQVHNYGQFISADPTVSAGLIDADIWDLANFLVEDTILTDNYIRPDTGTASGGVGRPVDIAIGKEYFTGINQHFGADDINCSLCHGKDGFGISVIELPTLAWSDPWKFFHRVRFGTPRLSGTTLTPPFKNTSTIMPGILEFTKQDGITPSDNDDAMHVLGYAQTILNGFTPP